MQKIWLTAGLTLLLAACSGGTPPQDLTLAGVSPDHPTVAQGQTLNLTLTFTSQNGFQGEVSLSVTENGRNPSWLTLSPTSKYLNVPKGGQVQETLQVQVAGDAPTGPHTLRLEATYGNRTAAQDLTLTVTGQPFAVLYEGLGTKALAVTSDGTHLYVAGFRQDTYENGLQDAMVWKLDGQGQVVAQRRIGSELLGYYFPVRVNDRAYALALHGNYLYVAGYLAGCDDTDQDTCEGAPFVAKLNPTDLNYVEAFGGNDFYGVSQPGVAILDPVDYSRSYAYTLAVDDTGVYVGGFGGTQGFLAVLDPATGQERERLVLGSADSQAKTHVEAVLVKDRTLYVAGHTNVPFDCDGNPTGPVAQSATAFVLKLSASDLTCNGGFGSGGVATLQTPGDTEILSLALSQDGTRLLAAGFGGETLAEGDTSVTFKGLARLWVLEPSTGQTVASFPDMSDYPYPISSHCQVDPGTYEQNITCADKTRGLSLASDGSLLLVGHVKGQVEAQDRFPGTEDGLTGSDLFFARYRVDGTRLDYQEVDFSEGTELGFGVVEGPGGHSYAVGSTTGPVGSLTDPSPKAIVLRFGP